MINPINSNGVKKSANEVINGIRKLFGSPPLRNIIIELMNNAPNNIKNKSVIVIIMINVIRKGFIIRIPVVIPIMKPNEINTIRLNKIVIKSPIKSSFILFEDLSFGGMIPI